jgi:hypothetical protein
MRRTALEGIGTSLVLRLKLSHHRFGCEAAAVRARVVLTVEELEAMRSAYEARGETNAAIAARFHMSTKTLQTMVLANGWRRRNRRHQADRTGIITRMFGILEQQVILLENSMRQAGEKEVAVLGKLASTLEKLIQIDNAAAEKPKEASTKEMTDLRNRLAERIEQLKRA